MVFEQAIILDTAGRYAIPVDEGRDKDEWQQFLRLLAKYRKREPLNGLILCVPADKLLQAGKESLQEDGRIIRRRMDELMRVLGAKFPVCVLVTKCDLVQGMTQFCDQLPEKRLEQAMGAINHALSADVTTFTKETVTTISERLRDLRLLLLHRTRARTFDPALLLFPEEFEKLEAGLAAFLVGAFEKNPYQETPLLRGILFSLGPGPKNAAGRTGVGAVMGSKKLKAIAARGTLGLEIAHPDEAFEVYDRMLHLVLKSKATRAIQEYGTMVTFNT